MDATTIYPAINRLEKEVAGIYKKLQAFMKASSRVCGLRLSAVWGVSQLRVYKDPVYHFNP